MQKTSKKRTGTKKTKGPKVRLAKNKVIFLSAIISGICVLALSLSVILNTFPSDSNKAEIQAINIAEKAKKSEKQSKATKKIEDFQNKKKTSVTNSKQTEEKPAVSKSSKAKATTEAKSVSQAKAIPKTQEKSVSSQNSQNIAQTRSQTERQEKVTPKTELSKNSTNSPNTKEQKPAQSERTKPEKAKASKNSQLASLVPPREQESIQQNIPKNRFGLPPAAKGATLVIVIDDAGRSVENTKRYASLPFPITIAVLPKLPNSRSCADAVRMAGKEVILHQPMQSTNLNLDPGPGKITADMSTYEIAQIVKQNLLELGPGVKGVNNHEGSLITSNVIKIGAVLEVCSEMGVYFLDSRTTAQTQAPQAALERDMHIFEKAGPYLDNDIDRAKMLERMRESLAYANRHGRAIVIGHVDKSVKILPDLLAEMYPEIKAAGYRLATPSMLR
ncbi:MAG: divergent polysaccharide deacetylase family protein [Treponema sp.]|nr:divergent polysaccharide deacetylase family protein [Treponema sp.]